MPIAPKMKWLRNKIFILSLIVLTVYIYLSYLLIVAWIKPSPLGLRSVKLPYVVVHLDLKGAPLKLKYLESILPMLKTHGVNGLMMEYEDMFPYEGKLINVSAMDCYGKKELKHFLKTAVQSGFEIIPLIQTFGHMEHVLKLQEFKHLREVEKYSDSICPTKMESRALIVHMLEQVINFHYSVVPLNYINIGCDEVLQMYKCPECVKKISLFDLFTDHVRFVADAVTKLSPHTTILFWDDMLRNTLPLEFYSLNPIHNTEPVYWRYDSDVQVSHKDLFDYHKKFKNIWIASAFKGADGIIASLPLFYNRLSNHFSWMNFIFDYKFGGEQNVYEFKGIILTGWSRYSHFGPLCELFPVAIPSLIANLLLINKFKEGFHDIKTINNISSFYTKYISEELSRSLKCEDNQPSDVLEAEFDMDIKGCNFESRNLFNIVNDYETMKSSIAQTFSDNNNIHASIEYYAKAKFIGVKSQETSIKWFEQTLGDLHALEKIWTLIMKKYYSDNVIQEYINSRTYSLKMNLEKHLKLLKSINTTYVWDRNPFSSTL